MQSELEAIETLLYLLPKATDVIIFTDSMSSIMSITSYTTISTREKRKNVQAFTLARIQNILNNRSAIGSDTKLEWIPSHIDQKKQEYSALEDKAKGAKKLKDLETRLDYLKENYAEIYESIAQGNEAADKLAKEATKLDRKDNTEWFPEPTTKYYIRDQHGCIIEGAVRKHLKTALNSTSDTELERNRQQSSNWRDGQVDLSKFSQKLSHQLNKLALQPKQTEETQKLDGLNTFRFRAMDRRLPTADALHKRAETCPTQEQADFLHQKYPSPNCQLCDKQTPETQNHVLYECEYTQQYRDEQQLLIEEMLHQSPTLQYIPNIKKNTRAPEATETALTNKEQGLVMLGYIPNNIKEQLKLTENKETTKIKLAQLHIKLVEITRKMWNATRKAVHQKYREQNPDIP
jgi:ribonuclease HI